MQAIAKGEGLDPDYLTVAALSAAATAIGTSQSVCIYGTSPVHPTLFTILAGRPGAGKSKPLEMMYRPLRKIDAERYKQALDDRTQSATSKTTYHPRVLGAYTPEVALSAHLHTPQGIAIYHDDISAFFKSTAKHGNENFLGLLSSAWSGVPLYYTSTGDDFPIMIDKPCINLVGCMPTSSAHEVLTNEVIKTGFADRMLFCFPEITQLQYWTGKASSKQADIDNSIAAQLSWDNIINALQNDKNTCHKPRRLAPDAADRLYDIHNKEAIDVYATQSNNIDTRYAKRPIHIARLALVLQCIGEVGGDYNKTGVVSDEAMAAADALEDYFNESLNRLMQLVRKDDAEPCRTPYEALYRLPEKFTTEEFYACVPAPNVEQKGHRWLMNLITEQRLTQLDGDLYMKIPRRPYNKHVPVGA